MEIASNCSRNSRTRDCSLNATAAWKNVLDQSRIPLECVCLQNLNDTGFHRPLRPLSIPTCDFVCFCKTDNFRSKMDKITVRTLGMVENMINHWNKMHTDALCAWLAVSGSLLADVRLPKKSSVKRKISDPASGHWESANEKNKSQNLIPSTLIAKNYQLNEVSGHVLWFRVFRFWVGNDKFPIHKRKEEMTWCEKCFDIPKEGYNKCNTMHF